MTNSFIHALKTKEISPIIYTSENGILVHLPDLNLNLTWQWACSQRNESRSENHFGTWFWPFPDLKAWFYPLWTQSTFKSGFWNAKKMAFWTGIDLESLILRTCERKALSECDSCMHILEMCAEVMHGSICAVGTKHYLAVRRSCSWLGRRLQSLVNACSSNHEPNQEGDRDPKRLSECDSLLSEQAQYLFSFPSPYPPQ